jgi:hypothetical protein
MIVTRKRFINLLVGATAVAALPLPAVAVSRKIDFPHGTRFRLFMMHNRLREGQRVFVWAADERYDFTVDNNTSHLPADRNWTCLGELRWVVDAKGEYFEHHLVPNFPRIIQSPQGQCRISQSYPARVSTCWVS